MRGQTKMFDFLAIEETLSPSFCTEESNLINQRLIACFEQDNLPAKPPPSSTRGPFFLSSCSKRWKSRRLAVQFRVCSDQINLRNKLHRWKDKSKLCKVAIKVLCRWERFVDCFAHNSWLLSFLFLFFQFEKSSVFLSMVYRNSSSALFGEYIT